MSAAAVARPTLLVVDDEPEVLRSISDLFRREAIVKAYPRGADALDALREGLDVDVILSDQLMPEMSGVEFLCQARVLAPDATRLLVTGHSEIRSIIDAINQGNIWHYVAKPWDPDELLVRVRQAAEQRRLIVHNRRLMEALEASNRLRGAFLEVIAHELRTPVTIVQGMAELWRITKGPQAAPEDRERMDKISAAARRLAAIVERVVATLEAGSGGDAVLRLVLGPLKPPIEAAADAVAPFLNDRGQALDLQLDPDLGEAEIDAEKLSDVLTNLLANAIKFSPDGATIEVWAGPDGPDWVALEVRDAGCGIAPTDRPYLFQPFFTGFDTMHHSTGQSGHNQRGIGLGLSLVRAFVGLHGGEVACADRPGGGTTFRVRLPRRSSARVDVRDQTR